MGIAFFTFGLLILIILGCFFVTESVHYKKILPVYIVITTILVILYVLLVVIKH